MLPAREYVAISRARSDLEDSKKRFVDDPAGALQGARRSVVLAMEARGYSNSGNGEGEPSRSRRELEEEYERTDVGESGNLEEQREAFGRLSNLLERLARA